MAPCAGSHVDAAEEKDQEGFGGGLAADGGRVYAATGFGYVVALDARTGKKLWEKNLGSPVRASPTAVGERVFVVTKEGHVFCLSGSDGTELWKFRGLPERASILVNRQSRRRRRHRRRALSNRRSRGAARVRAASRCGRNRWRARAPASSLAAMSDAARPVIDGGIVFAVGHAGRMVATSQKTGERLWSLTVASIQPPWVAGDSVFVVDTAGS